MNQEQENQQPRPTSELSLTFGATVSDVVKQVALIDEVLKKVMQRGQHYDVIPGTGDKPALLKAGAEKLCALFKLGTELDIELTPLADAHREYLIKCTVKHYPTGRVIGQGVGSCSTMESKYRYRNVADYEITGSDIPRDYKDRKKEYRKQGFGAKKIDGSWEWVKYGDEERSENPDVADTYNTVLKMAKKRSLVDAVLTATGASDLFTQDVEEMREKFADAEEVPEGKQEQKEAPPKESPPKRRKYEMKEEKPAPPPPESETTWVVDVVDVEEEQKGNKTVYVITFEDGRVARTLNRSLAGDAYAWIPDTGESFDKIAVSVKPGRLPNSWELVGVPKKATATNEKQADAKEVEENK